MSTIALMYLEVISLRVKQSINKSLKEVSFCYILADESTDMQQLKSFPSALYGLTVLVMRPIGLSACDSASIFTAIKTDLADSVQNLEGARENFNTTYLVEVSREIGCRFKDT